MSQHLSIIDIIHLFPNEQKSMEWIERCRWGDTVSCPRCGSGEITETTNRKPQPYWCQPCRQYFSVRTGTFMEKSSIPLQKWLIGIYLFLSQPKGYASTVMAKELGVRQATAWLMKKRMQAVCLTVLNQFSGTVEIDETYMGGQRKNRSKHQRMLLFGLGRGRSGKFPVIGALHRETNQIIAKAVDHTDQETMHAFIHEQTTQEAVIYTDEARCYRGMNRNHSVVCHSRREFVDGTIHTNGIESFWASVKRSYKGTHHWWSRQH